MSGLLDSFPIALFPFQPEGQSGTGRNLWGSQVGRQPWVSPWTPLSTARADVFRFTFPLVQVARPVKHFKNLYPSVAFVTTPSSSQGAHFSPQHFRVPSLSWDAF